MIRPQILLAASGVHDAPSHIAARNQKGGVAGGRAAVQGLQKCCQLSFSLLHFWHQLLPSPPLLPASFSSSPRIQPAPISGGMGWNRRNRIIMERGKKGRLIGSGDGGWRGERLIIFNFDFPPPKTGGGWMEWKYGNISMRRGIRKSDDR